MNPLTAPLSATGTTVDFVRSRLRLPGVLILGLGNSGNNVRLEAAGDDLAAAIAAHPACPRISNAELAAIVEALRRRAGQGEVDAAQLIFKIAMLQQEIAEFEASQATTAEMEEFGEESDSARSNEAEDGIDLI
jgi:hypothetical protein